MHSLQFSLIYLYYFHIRQILNFVLCLSYKVSILQMHWSLCLTWSYWTPNMCLSTLVSGGRLKQLLQMSTYLNFFQNYTLYKYLLMSVENCSWRRSQNIDRNDESRRNNPVILHIQHLRQNLVLTVSLLGVPNMTLCVSDLIWLGKNNIFKVAVTFPPFF